MTEHHTIDPDLSDDGFDETIGDDLDESGETDSAAGPGGWPGERATGWLMLVAGLVSLVASLTLAIEKVELLINPQYVPSCNISPVFSCGSIMKTEQASAFGFPNPFMGIGGFAAVAVVGAAILAGARMQRWFWLAVQVGATFGLGFVCWLIFQSLYRIGALCPYCMVVWAMTLPLFWYITVRNATHGVFGRAVATSAPVRFAESWHAAVLIVGYLVVVAMIALRFFL